MTVEEKNVCGNPACAIIYWPGSPPLIVCEDHQFKALRIADAMSFDLSVTFDAPLLSRCQSRKAP